MGTENLDKIFNPRRIAIIGASDRENSLGAKLLRNLIGVGYKGVVYPVNPFRPTVQGITAYPSITKIPWQVDLAIIATPAHTVPQIVEECGKAGVAGIIIVSAGFKETGKEGEALEAQILKLKNQYGMRVIGPNSFGVMRPKIKLNATFSNRTAIPGKIAFISQSAALCASGLDWTSEAYLGFSAVVSTGSMLDVDFGDLIDYFGSDPQTRSIVLYMESIKNARKFMSAARGFARAKPIVVVKAGRFDESVEPTFCHTGALCGEDAVYDAAFRRVGVVRVEAISDLFKCAETLAMQPNPKGPNLTIITNAGGPAIMATDCLIAKGGKLSSLSSETVQALKSILPSYCSFTNPVDILEEATPERFRKVVETCFNDPNSNGFLVLYTPQGATDPVSMAKTIVEISKQTTKPILTVLMGEDECWKARRVLQKNGIPAFTTPEQAVSIFMYMYSYTQNLELLYQMPEEISVELSVPSVLREILRKAFNEGREVLTQPESFQFLEAYKIPTIKTVVAKSPDEAETFSSDLGYPVVMKALSPQITHKSKAEGVILNIWSPTEVRAFFYELAGRVRNYKPEAEFQGVVIQPMIQKHGYELLIGAKRDLQFGSVIVFGAGGIATELWKDTAIGFPPLNQVLARRLMERIAIYKHLTSNGQLPNARVLEEILVKFSQIVIDYPEIKEIDINPLIFDGTNAVAVDARIAIDKEKILHGFQPHEHLVIAPYPKKYVSQWQLKDGTSVLLRPIKPEDEPLLDELFKSLSEETMRLRFFQVIKDMTHETLTRYCNLDYDREVAIVAEAQKDKRRLIGVGRVILEPGGKNGEFAVVVGDQWQGHGLGSKLIDCIIQIGKDAGLETIYGYVISDNTKMINLCTKKGFKMEPFDEEAQKATLNLA
ncbi:MAG: bifunctional acetate--CoA ligase family protein/GNAT family N-acetyltransferase [Candidatus Bathyarchaeia archaeon]|nr:bifunctional acetate--CoA ligase family protein/GNAT family N-acetyltransferase [Candidatus Bathyarchaeota archaeon A05DMB-4]MDH7594576.1 bifunctional acetate--CoA ligase family protein/GNAT family N-acetyltransferase [Candidatus Bathyarchaeota archaeon]